MTSGRGENEKRHGAWLAAQDTERVWGWGSAAGKLRAARRGELIAAGARLSAGQSVLEIGCGTGLFTEMFARSGASILAVDISRELAAIASSRLSDKANVRVVAAPFEDCGAEGPFDAVIGSSILHHLDVDAALSKIFALLKPGGRLCFAEPNMLNPQIFAERNFRQFFPQVSPDETAFVRWRVARLLGATGYSAVEITPFDWLHPATPEALIPAIRAVGALLERLPVVREGAGSMLMSAQRPRA